MMSRAGKDGQQLDKTPLEHDAQPYQGYQHQLVVKERGDHGKIPSRRWSNEDIVRGFQTVGMSRRLEVQDHQLLCGGSAR
jgi:hypothetical protein